MIEGTSPTDRKCDLVIQNAQLLDSDRLVDVCVCGERIVDVVPRFLGHAACRIDASGGVVTTSYVEPHFHLDKTLTRDLFGAVSPEEAFSRARDVKVQFTVGNVEERACRALHLAIAHGVGCLRAMVDVDSATRLVSFEGVLRASNRVAHAIEVQIVAFPQEGIVTDRESPDLLREAIKSGATVVGGLPEIEHTIEDQKRHIDTVLDIAEETGVSVDMHCDYLDDPALKTLEMLADATMERGLQGRVVAGHCCALAVYDDDEASRVIEKLTAAKISVTVLPLANLQMLGWKPGEGNRRTPYNRGSSRVKELLDAGVNVAAGSDNMYDIWYRFNRMDPVQTALGTILSAGMRTDGEVRTAFDMVTTRAYELIGLQARGVVVGAQADLVVHEARTLVDILRNLPGHRTHIKSGRRVGGTEGSAWTVD